jgi:hypothetical protein
MSDPAAAKSNLEGKGNLALLMTDRCKFLVCGVCDRGGLAPPPGPVGVTRRHNHRSTLCLPWTQTGLFVRARPNWSERYKIERHRH